MLHKLLWDTSGENPKESVKTSLRKLLPNFLKMFNTEILHLLLVKSNEESLNELQDFIGKFVKKIFVGEEIHSEAFAVMSGVILKKIRLNS